jgi:hypothetical protein
VSRLADAHIEGQRRLRERAAAAALAAWDQLDSYSREDEDTWLALVLPLMLGAQRASALLTNQFVARAVGRQPLAIDLNAITGAAIRNGTEPRDVYRRALVAVWSDMKHGKLWEDAVRAGGERAAVTAQTDIQLTMRTTLREIGQADDRIVGFQRVPDGDACEFCRLIAGRRYLKSGLMPVHPRCGCGVDVITQANRGDFTGKVDNDLDLPAGVTVREHGELGPTLVHPDHDFTGPDALAA